MHSFFPGAQQPRNARWQHGSLPCRRLQTDPEQRALDSTSSDVTNHAWDVSLSYQRIPDQVPVSQKEDMQHFVSHELQLLQRSPEVVHRVMTIVQSLQETWTSSDHLQGVVWNLADLRLANFVACYLFYV